MQIYFEVKENTTEVSPKYNLIPYFTCDFVWQFRQV
jgi:hypothetical protein